MFVPAVYSDNGDVSDRSIQPIVQSVCGRVKILGRKAGLQASVAPEQDSGAICLGLIYAMVYMSIPL
jgi:tetrahydromethanopterin S-methyltransferase subunit F